MSSTKIELREQIESIKKDFNKSRDRKDMFKAAVLKGVYRGIGGSKGIVLPIYCDNIVNIVSAITRARKRFKGSVLDKVNKIEEELLKEYNALVGFDVLIEEDRVRLALNLVDVYGVVIEVSPELDEEDMAKIATSLIEIEGIGVELGADSVRYIRQQIENCLKEW